MKKNYRVHAAAHRSIRRTLRCIFRVFLLASFIPGISHAFELITITEPEPTEIETVCPELPGKSQTPVIGLKQVRDRLAGNSGAAPRLRIVALGSSSTQGHGASSMADTYPHRLGVELVKAHPGLTAEIVNAGRGGETLRNMKERIVTDVLARNPDLVIWQVGSNAVLRGVSLSDAEKHLREGIDLIRKRNIDIVLMGMQFAPAIVHHEGHLGMRRLISNVAQELNIPVFDRFGLMRSWQNEADDEWLDKSLHPDGLHMTSTSYRCLASALANFLAAHAQQKPPPQAPKS